MLQGHPHSHSLSLLTYPATAPGQNLDPLAVVVCASRLELVSVKVAGLSVLAAEEVQRFVGSILPRIFCDRINQCRPTNRSYVNGNLISSL